MKHIDISKPMQNGLAEIMISQESNNFGDQILTLKKYIKSELGSGYQVIDQMINQEGSWIDLKEMKSWAKTRGH